MMEVIVDVINEAVETLTEAEVARAKAQMKAGLLDGAGELQLPRRAIGAARAGLRAAAEWRSWWRGSKA